ncbi:hypothetical protein BCR32DRAFT_328434 [Anaeromyces robustus]|uniref:Uncharacterized protein n=1 Tax=Anaeromyces robustus TaxID=1754192 RepID=A0A1Y1WZ58_9FUNG|nr:hypothetical protein BCR32DRAFT_328434 [Anaeromyces robustus]|eukprot:ORX78675.1 hypothetical protein BCR32DRAFT_328434 [Anaeromyces robustus]
MKLSTLLLSLLATSTVYSHSLEHRFVIRAEKSDDLLNMYTEECRNAIKENKDYYSCMIYDFNLENRKEVCDLYFSEKCQNFLKDMVSPVPACKNDPLFMQNANKPIYIDNSHSAMKFYCINDGEGNVCPGAKLLIEGKSVTTGNIDQNCSSKKCLDGMMDYIKFKRDNSEKLCEAGTITSDCQEFKSIMDKLLGLVDNDECRAKAKDDTKTDDTKTNTTSSGANSIKVNVTLLVFALIFSLF